MNINLETVPCVFAHPQIENLFYCKESPQGMTQNIAAATKYVGGLARENGITELMERFPKIKQGQLIYTYILG